MNSEERNIERIKRFGLDCKVADRCFHNGIEYVDLGLPSGTKWATMNVGANSIEDSGLYFQWGDTQGYTSTDIEGGKKVFREGDYKYRDYKFGSILKYNEQDGKTVLDPDDDATHFQLGGDWRMPTRDDFKELYKHTTGIFYSINKVNGCKFVSKKDKTKWVFFPETGCAIFEGVGSMGYYGYYWSSSLYSAHSAYILYFNSSGIYANYYNSRYYGQVIRGVFK